MLIEHPLAPRWRRLVALCYESLLTFAILLVTGGAYQLLLGISGVAATDIAGSALLRNLMGLVWMGTLYAYYAWCWGRGGQTLAMKTWRLQLRNQANQLPDAKAIAVRFGLALLAYGPLVPTWAYTKHHPDLKWLLWLAIVWTALPWLWSLLDREKQCLHDRLAGTHIVLLPVSRAD